MTIAITGATGQLGRLVIGKLKTRTAPSNLVALVRSASKAADLGIAAREADYTRPETLAAALQGVGTLMFISSSEVGQRVPQHRNVIEAARSAGVKRIVYTSLLRADTSVLDVAAEHVPTEQMLKACGIAYTILRNGWYTANYTASVPGTLAGGVLMGSAGDGRISSAERADYAEAAAVVLTSPGHEGKTYELAGDVSFTLADLAAEISRQTGKAITYKNLPEADYASALVGFGVPEGFARAIAKWDVGAATGALFDDGRQLSRLIGRPTATLAASMAEALKHA